MSFLNCKVIFSILLLCGLALAVDDLKDGPGSSPLGTLWFGPRLGKRSLRISNEDNNRQTFLRLLEAADALKYYYEQLPFYEAQADDPETRVTKKVIFTPKLGRSADSYQARKSYEHLEFTPRLGRRITEALPVTPSDNDVYSYKPDSGADRRTNYLLGRKINFSPRLGREMTDDIYPENIRLARSVNVSKTS